MAVHPLLVRQLREQLSKGPDDVAPEIEALCAAISQSYHEHDQRRLRLERTLAELGSAASHDLRAPLRHVGQLTEWLAEELGEGLSGEAKELLDLLRARAQRLDDLVAALVDFARAGGSTGEAKDLDLKKLVQAVLAAQPRTGFIVEVASDLPTIHSPQAPLERVLRELCNNAIGHHDSQTGRLNIGWQDRGAFIELSVADDGPGIPEKLRDAAFRLFRTLKARDEREAAGGGLAIARRIVECAGGSIGLEENEPRGTVVRFTWPRHSEGEAPKPSQR
jgi:signal transduction histidine kinase